MSSNLHDRINWQFSVMREGQISRYGTAGGYYYKQYLPGGMVMEERHPPKQIVKAAYDLAYRFSKQEV